MKPLARMAALVLAVAWFSGGAGSLAETPKNSGPEVFVEAFQRYLQETASKCAATPEFLALEQQRYAWEREINSRKAPPRDVICFSYAGDFRAFKADLKAFLADHGKEHRAKTYGGWQHDDWYTTTGEAKVGKDEWHKAKLFGSRRGVDRIEVEIASIPGAVIFEERSGTVGVFYERRKK